MTGPVPPGRDRFPPAEPTNGQDEDACWYFLSHSEEKEFRGQVERFHRDLESMVRSLLGNTPGGGFMDSVDIETSERWRPLIWNTARKTASMIALYSPRYFGSDWCGREWAVFVERMRRHVRQGGRARHLIILIWHRGRTEWPEGADEFQHLTWKFGSMYEERGLFHVVPEEGPADREYRDIIYEVAQKVADAVLDPEIPPISAEDAQAVVPLFGRRALRTVDIVVSYADTESDTAWGHWMMSQLRAAGYTVDPHVLSPDSGDTVHVIRNSLRRARKVILALSEHYLTTGDLTDTVLDEALSDGSSDWQRLFPVVVLPGPRQVLPDRIQEFCDVHIGGTDAAAARETLLRVAAAPSRETRRQPAYPGLPDTAAHPAYPGASLLAVRDLVNELRKATSVRQPSVRGVWLAETGLDLSSLNLSFPLRSLLFEIARICLHQTGGYEPLADALEILEPHSPASRAVRGVVTRMTPPPTAPAS
jgi:hypothetical protein